MLTVKRFAIGVNDLICLNVIINCHIDKRYGIEGLELRKKRVESAPVVKRIKVSKTIRAFVFCYCKRCTCKIRQNNKKQKFWYAVDQLEQIEKIVTSASQYAELTLETRGNKIVSFTVIDTLNNSVRFTGYFT